MVKHATQQERILIVEDESGYFDTVKRALPGLDFDHVESVDGVRAALIETNYELIIADLVLTNTNEKLDDFGKLIFAIEQVTTKKKVFRPSIIVLTGRTLDAEELQKAINDHSGWIWGWHVKTELTKNEDFRQNVLRALENRRSITPQIASDSTNQSVHVERIAFWKIVSSMTLPQISAVVGTLVAAAGIIARIAYVWGTMANQIPAP